MNQDYSKHKNRKKSLSHKSLKQILIPFDLLFIKISHNIS